MAKRRKPSIRPTRKNLIKIKGDSARRYRIKGSKKIISRRQAEYILRPKGIRLKATQSQKHKLDLYRGVRDSYIEAQRAKGKVIGKRQAMNSDELKKIILDLHSKNPKVKARALAKTGRITRDQIEQYVEKFSSEGV